jgi:hypothetical protein
VQVAPQPTTFFFTRGYQSFAGLLQVVGQPHGVDRDASLARQIRKQPLVSQAERLARGAWRK